MKKPFDSSKHQNNINHANIINGILALGGVAFIIAGGVGIANPAVQAAQKTQSSSSHVSAGGSTSSQPAPTYFYGTYYAESGQFSQTTYISSWTFTASQAQYQEYSDDQVVQTNHYYNYSYYTAAEAHQGISSYTDNYPILFVETKSSTSGLVLEIYSTTTLKLWISNASITGTWTKGNFPNAALVKNKGIITSATNVLNSINENRLISFYSDSSLSKMTRSIEVKRTLGYTDTKVYNASTSTLSDEFGNVELADGSIWYLDGLNKSSLQNQTKLSITADGMAYLPTLSSSHLDTNPGFAATAEKASVNSSYLDLWGKVLVNDYAGDLSGIRLMSSPVPSTTICFVLETSSTAISQMFGGLYCTVQASSSVNSTITNYQKNHGSQTTPFSITLPITENNYIPLSSYSSVYYTFTLTTGDTYAFRVKSSGTDTALTLLKGTTELTYNDDVGTNYSTYGCGNSLDPYISTYLSGSSSGIIYTLKVDLKTGNTAGDSYSLIIS